MEIPNKSFEKDVSLTAEVERFRAEAERLKGVIEDKDWASQKTNEGIKVLYHELEKQTAELKKLDQLKSNFISTVSHELRTPLAIIREGIALVNDGTLGEINHEQSDYLKDVLEGADRLTNLINNLLDTSRLEAGKVELQSTDIDTAELIQKVVSSFQIKARLKSITLQIDPSTSQAPHIHGDEEKIVQVLTNLIGNAVKFTPEAGRITIGVEPGGQEIRIFVRDTGIGISAEDQKRLFNKFEQFGRSAGPGEKGTGLGLAICKEIVELQGGKIDVISEVGKGSTFYFSLTKQLPSKEMCEYLIQKNLGKVKLTVNEPELCVLFFKLELRDPIQQSFVIETREKLMTKLETVIKIAITRSDDAWVRYSPDAIMVLLGHTDQVGAASVARKIKKLFNSEKMMLHQTGIVPAVRYGIANYPKDADRADGLIQSAYQDLDRKRRIIIVDDHEKSANLLAGRLKTNPRLCLECVFNGEEALSNIKREKPDLIVLYVVMPKMSVHKVIGRLKETVETRAIPIVILTEQQVTATTKRQMVGSENIDVISKGQGFDKVEKFIDEML